MLCDGPGTAVRKAAAAPPSFPRADFRLTAPRRRSYISGAVLPFHDSQSHRMRPRGGRP